jgi:hypothetical protein
MKSWYRGHACLSARSISETAKRIPVKFAIRSLQLYVSGEFNCGSCTTRVPHTSRETQSEVYNHLKIHKSYKYSRTIGLIKVYKF